jgi:peptide/nickel transport system substrate-binding protein
MTNRRKLIAACLFGSMLIACAAAAQTLRIGLSGDPDTLDPTQTRHGSGFVVRTALCDRLFDIGPELEIVPQLATDWQWTDDRKGLVIKLRHGVKFHDGEPFDAAAVKYNIERHLTMPGSARRSDIRPISGVEVIDEHTAKIALSGLSRRCSPNSLTTPGQ